MPRSLLALAVSLAARRTIGSTLCSDHHTSCAHWANGGDCWGENATTVIKTCPASCGICRPGCEDLEPECRHWAQDGECYSNSGPVRLLLPRVHFVTLTPVHSYKTDARGLPSLVRPLHDSVQGPLPSLRPLGDERAPRFALLAFARPKETSGIVQAVGVASSRTVQTELLCCVSALLPAACAPPCARTRTPTVGSGPCKTRAL